MKSERVLVRVYLAESRARLRRLLALLRESGKIRGATVFRGIAGFGTSSPEDEDASEPRDPPVVIEFFGSREEALDAVRFIRTLVAPRHVVCWPVEDMLASLAGPRGR